MFHYLVSSPIFLFNNGQMIRFCTWLFPPFLVSDGLNLLSRFSSAGCLLLVWNNCGSEAIVNPSNQRGCHSNTAYPDLPPVLSNP